MCRNIKMLFNLDPPSTDEEIRGASRQFVRKLGGFNAPSRVNEEAFERAIDEVSRAAQRYLHALVTTTPPRSRQDLEAKARERSARRFPRAG